MTRAIDQFGRKRYQNEALSNGLFFKNILLQNILFNGNCRQWNISSLQSYGVRKMCFFDTQFNLIFFNLNKTKLIWIYDREKRPYKSKSTCNHKKDIQYHKRPYETTIVRSGPCYVLQSHRWPWKHKAMILSLWTRDFLFNMNQFSLRTFYVRSTNFLLMIPRFQQEQEQQHQQQQQGFFKDLWAMLAVKKNMLSCITDSI